MINIELILSEDVPSKLLFTIDSIGVNRIADVYYFVIDNSFMPNEETDEKVVLGLQNLYNYWKYSIEKLQPEQVAYLPFDYSDQYIGCISIRALKDDNLLIRYGFSEDYSSYNPSDADTLIITEENFNSAEEFDTCDKSELLDDINRFLAELRLLLT